MTDLVAHGIEVTLPTGWEGRVFKRPSTGEVTASDVDGPPAPQGETTHAVLHVSTIALPVGVGDFASGAVDKLGTDDALIVLFEYDPASIDQPLFQAEGLPKRLAEADFSPNVLQRNLKGQAGVQRFFHDAGRAFCLYVVLGAYVNRRTVVPEVNQVLATLTVEPVDAADEPTGSPTTTVAPDTSTTEPSTGESPGNEAPTTPEVPPTTAPSGP
jgi:hypothetical protein